jgi:hypothetical protein
VMQKKLTLAGSFNALKRSSPLLVEPRKRRRLDLDKHASGA